MTAMIGTKRAIRDAFHRLGLHTTPKRVVQALAQRGILVDLELVRQVRFEMLKETTGIKQAKFSKPVLSQSVRRRPQGFPGKKNIGRKS